MSAYAYVYVFIFPPISATSKVTTTLLHFLSDSLVCRVSLQFFFYFLFYFYFKKILIYFLKQRILLHWGGFPSSYSQKMLFYFPHIHVKKCTIRVVLIHQSYFLIQSYLYYNSSFIYFWKGSEAYWVLWN
jgi:hypothetical protein